MPDLVLAKLPSPALRLSAPLVSGEPLHPAAEGRQRQGWADAARGACEIRVLAVDDALVTHNGLAFRPDGSVVVETARKFTREAIESAAASVAGRHLVMERIDMDAVLCMRPGATCYGHVLAEIMPAAWLVRRLLPEVDASLLVWTRPELLDLYRQIAAAVGAGGMPVVNCSAPVRVRRLLVVDGFAQTDGYLSPHVRDFASEVLGSPGPRAGGSRRLFVPRRPEQGRSVRNLDAVAACLLRHGFETVYPEDLRWREQVALFSSATHVVGVLGSALTTTLFCRAGTQVLALAPVRMVDTFFWRIAGCCGLGYEELRCRMLEGVRSHASGRLLDQDIEVDVDLLDARLAASGSDIRDTPASEMPGAMSTGS